MTGKCKRTANKWARGLLAAVIALLLPAGGGTAPASGRMAAAGLTAQASAGGTAVSAGVKQPPPAPPTAEPAGPFAGKRDPFQLPPPPDERKEDRSTEPLPPGKRGLVIGQLKLKGIVHQIADNTMIAVVTNRANRAYFLRVHDEVYNGVVSRITAGSIHFKENQVERGGRIGTREIVLRLRPPSEEGR